MDLNKKYTLSDLLGIDKLKMQSGGKAKGEWDFTGTMGKSEVDFYHEDIYVKDELLNRSGEEKIEVPEEFDFINAGEESHAFKVEYHIEPEFREYGIKSLSTIITRIHGDIKAEWYTDSVNYKGKEYEYVKFDTKNILWTQSYRNKGEEDRWLIKTDFDNRDNDRGISVYPTALRIDFETKEIEVTF